MNFGSFLHKLNLRSTRLFPSFKIIVTVCLISLISLSVFSLVKPAKADIISDFHSSKLSKNSVEWYVTAPIFQSMAINWLDVFFGNEVSFTPKTGWVPGGMIGNTNQLVGELYKQPISGTQYIAHVWGNFLGKPAYAQGVGFAGLQPILPIWTQFRNIAYLLSSLFFIIIGMMIILRVKISPQATITIQNAIPQLVTTLILITFSYAIAGLMIDATYVIQGMAALAIYPDATRSNFFLNALNSLLPFIGKLIPTFENMVEPNIVSVFGTLIVPSLSTIMLGTLIGFIVISIMGPLGSIVGTAVSAIAMVIIMIILALGILVWLFKFLIGLFKCYAMVIFKIIVAPLEIGMGAFPNSKIGFSSWFFDLISNLFVFPISFAFLMLSNRIIESIVGTQISLNWTALTTAISTGNVWTSNTSSSLWVPSMLGGTDNVSGTIVAAGAIGLSTLMLLSKLPDMIPQFIFMIKPSPWGQAIGQGLGEIQKSTPYQATETYAKGFGYREGGNIISTIGGRIGGRVGTEVINFGNAMQDVGDPRNVKDSISKKTLG